MGQHYKEHDSQTCPGLGHHASKAQVSLDRGVEKVSFLIHYHVGKVESDTRMRSNSLDLIPVIK